MQTLLRFLSLVALLYLVPISTLTMAREPAPKRSASPSRAGAEAAKPFEGTAKIRITHERIGTHVLDYSVKASRLRTEFPVSEAAHAAAIVDLTNDEVYVLLPGQPLYVSMSIEGSAELALGHDVTQVTIEKTRTRKKILGYSCTKYLVRNQDDSFEVWATEQLGNFMGLGAALPADAKFTPAWFGALVGKGFFPLRIQSLPGSPNALTLETLEVTPGAQPDELFAPPSGYRKFQMGGLIDGILGHNH